MKNYSLARSPFETLYMEMAAPGTHIATTAKHAKQHGVTLANKLKKKPRLLNEIAVGGHIRVGRTERTRCLQP